MPSQVVGSIVSGFGAVKSVTPGQYRQRVRGSTANGSDAVQAVALGQFMLWVRSTTITGSEAVQYMQWLQDSTRSRSRAVYAVGS